MPSFAIYYSWQNPILRDVIYPFRSQKLREFLMIYAEIDAWSARKITRQDSVVVAEIRQNAAGIRLARKKLKAELEEALTAEAAVTPEFANISGSTDEEVKTKQIDYLNKNIALLNERIRDLNGTQAELQERLNIAKQHLRLSRPSDDPERQVWESAIRRLNKRRSDSDQQLMLQNERLRSVENLRRLFTEQDRLPRLEKHGEITQRDQALWELGKYQANLKWLGHDELLQEVLTRFDAEPDRFNLWTQFIIVHFSGLRYYQLPKSWSDPKFLLEVFTRDLLKNEINKMTDGQVEEALNDVIAELRTEQTALKDKNQIDAIQWVITGLLSIPSARAAYFEYRRNNAIEQIQNLPEREATFIDQFKLLKESFDRVDPLPDWIWHTLMQATSLQLIYPEEEQGESTKEIYENQVLQWRLILDAWERKDITGWRQRHGELFDMIVTKALYHQIPELIQLLRGLMPMKVLADKPLWYLRMAQANPRKAYFKRPSSAEDFREGASLFFLDWVERKPPPWQIARPFPGIDFWVDLPKTHLFEDQTNATEPWTYQLAKSQITRTRPRQKHSEGVSLEKDPQVSQSVPTKSRRATEKQYLSWTSEAIVVGVAELIDGLTVLTFETGQNGLMYRPLRTLVDNPNIFIGYTPATSYQPDFLPGMLLRGRLSPAD